MNLCILLGLLCICDIVVCIHDYYAGVFNRNDLLVAQDVLYKDKVFYHTATANYFRSFKCPISYYRVQDRLGVAQGPRLEKLKGGLRQNFIVLRFTSVFNRPISVNIYIACANKQEGNMLPMYTRAPWTRAAVAVTKKDDDVKTDTKAPTKAPVEPGTTKAATGESNNHVPTQETPTTPKAPAGDEKTPGEVTTPAEDITTTTEYNSVNG